jgi:drug/metabolite transporter (DMT)-like permease
MAGKYLTMSILPLAVPSVAGEDGGMGSQGLAEDGTAAPPAAAHRQRPDRRRWLGRAGSLPGGPGAWVALLVVWLVWGSTYIAIRVADESLPPLAMAGTRYLIAGTLLFPFARRSGGPQLRAADRPGIKQWLAMAVVGTLLLACGNGAASYAEKDLPAGLTALLIATVPIWMVLADKIINGRAIPRTGWAALIIGVVGVGILARPHGHESILSVLIVLGGSLCWGTGSVLAGRLPAPERPLLGSAMEMLAGGAVLAVLAAATGELSHFDPGQVSDGSALALLYLIGPGSLLAMSCYVIALRRLPTAAVSTYAYVNPVVAVSLGALILGERLTLTTVLGGAVVLASVVLLLLHRSRELWVTAASGAGPSPPGSSRDGSLGQARPVPDGHARRR